MSKTLILEEVPLSELVDEEEYLVMLQDDDNPYFEIAMYHYDCDDNSSWVLKHNQEIKNVGDEFAIFEAPENGYIDSDEERIDDDTIEDGFGNVWSIICPICHKRTMEVVRPGKVQCTNCE